MLNRAGKHLSFGNTTLLILSAAISLLLLGLSFAFFGVEWDFYDGFNVRLIDGIATRGLLKNLYIAFPLLPQFYIWLQSHYPAVPWFSSSFFIMLWAANTAFIFLCLLAFKQSKLSLVKGRLLGGCFLLLVFVIQLPSYTHASITGMAFLAGASSILLVVKFAFSTVGLARKIILYTAAAVMFIWGCCLRIDAVFGAMVILGVYYLLSSVNLKQALIAAFPLLAIAVGVFVYTARELGKVPFIYDTEFEFYYLSDGVNDNGFYAGFSEKDSMKAIAIKRFFMYDEKELTVDFVKSLVDKKIQAERKAGVNFITRVAIAWQIARTTILANCPYLVLNLFFLLAAWLANTRNKLRVLIFQVAFWMIVLSVAYLSKLEDRHYIYMVQIFSYCNILLLFQSDSERLMSKNIVYPATALLAFLGGWLFYKSLSNVGSIRQREKNTDLAELEVNKIGKHKILVLDGESKNLFYSLPFTIRRYDESSDIVWWDMGHMVLFPEYEAYLDNLCHCHSRDIVQFFDYLTQHKDSVLFISTDNRMAFNQAYLKIVHGKNISVNKLPGTFAIQQVKGNDSDSLFYYQVGN